jgi:hypothetical protein
MSSPFNIQFQWSQINNRAGWSSSNALALYLAGVQFEYQISCEGFCAFPQSTQANTKIVPRLGHNQFLPLQIQQYFFFEVIVTGYENSKG